MKGEKGKGGSFSCFIQMLTKKIEECVSLKLTPFLFQTFWYVIADDCAGFFREREVFPVAYSWWEVSPKSNTLIAFNLAYFHRLCAYTRVLITVPETSLQRSESFSVAMQVPEMESVQTAV